MFVLDELFVQVDDEFAFIELLVLLHLKPNGKSPDDGGRGRNRLRHILIFGDQNRGSEHQRHNDDQ